MKKYINDFILGFKDFAIAGFKTVMTIFILSGVLYFSNDGVTTENLAFLMAASAIYGLHARNKP